MVRQYQFMVTLMRQLGEMAALQVRISCLEFISPFFINFKPFTNNSSDKMQGSSLYSATRNSIEAGILELQNKIRRRKDLQLQSHIDPFIIKSDRLTQYDLELHQLMRVYEDAKDPEGPLFNTINSPVELSSFNHPMSASINPLINKNTLESISYDTVRYDPSRWSSVELQERIKKQTFHLEYLRRIEELRRQENLQHQQRLVEESSRREHENIVQKQYLQNKLIEDQLYEAQAEYERQIQLISKQKQIAEVKLQDSQERRLRDHIAFQDTLMSSEMASKGSPVRNLTKGGSPNRYRTIEGQGVYASPLVSTSQEGYNRLQYDDPIMIEEDSSELVDKYSRGVKAREYYQEIQKIRELEDRIVSTTQYTRPEVRQALMNSPQLASKNYDTSDHAGINLKQQRTKEKHKKLIVPMIKEDSRQGAETVVNASSKKSKKQAVISLPVTKAFFHPKIKDVITGQKKQSCGKVSNTISNKTRPLSAQKILNSNRSNSHGQSSSRRLHSKSMYGNTIDFSVLGVKMGNPTKKVYLGRVHQKIVKCKNKKYKSLKASMQQSRNRSGSKAKNRSNYRQIYIPAPLYPASQAIVFPQSVIQKLSASCNQKIESRLRVSYVMHRDSKMRNKKHEVDHLLSKFGNEVKGRKEVKERINSNPRIMRRHKMVVE